MGFRADLLRNINCHNGIIGCSLHYLPIKDHKTNINYHELSHELHRVIVLR